MSEICPKCVLDDAIESEFVAPGIRRFVCSNKHGGDGPFVWEGPDLEEIETRDNSESEGIAASLGVPHDLLRCVYEGEGWVEYGIVEDRFRTLSPDTFDQLVERYGHTQIGPEDLHRKYTASAFLASALGQLERKGELEFMAGKATGPWSYNGTISYWARPPKPSEAKRQTFESYTQSRDSSGGKAAEKEPT